MAPKGSSLASLRPWICTRCLLQANKQQRRNVSRSHLEKLRVGQDEWAARAKEIDAGERKSMLSILYERGLVHDIAGDSKVFERVLNRKRLGVYCGIDPTAPSLHVGHMLPMMALFWMHLHGYRTVSLIGGATSKIGDPTGRTTDRPEMTPTERKGNLASMHYQVKKLWLGVEALGRKHGYHKDRHWRRALVNNSVWWNTIPFVDVLKYLGTGLRIGTMLSRDTVKTKMESGVGMSFAEFSYPLLQAWDWWHLYQSQEVQVQIGGSDQYGNIVAGVEAVKYMAKTHPDPDIRQENLRDEDSPFGFTVPLLTTASGQKFGKSAGNAIWLDSQMTSSFDLYGFFVGTADDDVRRYLKMFTFLPIPEISKIYDKHMLEPSKRSAQHCLAYEFVELVHGEAAAKHAQQQHHALFANRAAPTLSSLMASQSEASESPQINYQDQSELPTVPKNPLHDHQHWRTKAAADFVNQSVNKYAPQTNATTARQMHTVLPKSLVYAQSIAKVLWSAGLVSSRSEGHRLALNSGAYIGRNPSNKEGMRDAVEFFPAKLRDPHQTWDNVIRDIPESGEMVKPGEEGLLVLRTGKWKVRLCRIVSDDKFKELLAEGQVSEPPGWTEHVAENMAARATSRNAQQKLQKAELENRLANAEALKSEEMGAAADPVDIDLDSEGLEAAGQEDQPHPTPKRTHSEEEDADNWNDSAWDEVVELKPARAESEQARHEQHQAAFKVLEQRSVSPSSTGTWRQDSPSDRQVRQAPVSADGESLRRPRPDQLASPGPTTGPRGGASQRRNEPPSWIYGPDKRNWPADVHDGRANKDGPRVPRRPQLAASFQHKPKARDTSSYQQPPHSVLKAARRDKQYRAARNESISAWEERQSPFNGIGDGVRQMSRDRSREMSKEAEKARKRTEKEDKIRQNRDKIMARRLRNEVGAKGVRPRK